MTRFATVWPGRTLRLDVEGTAFPPGKIVRWLGEVALVAVAFSATAATPVNGTPFLPVTWTLRTCRAPTGPPPVRVSSSRAGGSALKRPAFVGDALGPYQPSTSTTTSVCPLPLKRLTAPFAPPATASL